MRNNRGLTLFEILTAIFIIAIMAAFAVPQYQRSVERVKAQEALSFLPQLRDAYISYYYENGAYPPPNPGAQGGQNATTAGLDIDIPDFKYFIDPWIFTYPGGIGGILSIRRDIAPGPNSQSYLLTMDKDGNIKCCPDNQCDLANAGTRGCVWVGLTNSSF